MFFIKFHHCFAGYISVLFNTLCYASILECYFGNSGFHSFVSVVPFTFLIDFHINRYNLVCQAENIWI